MSLAAEAVKEACDDPKCVICNTRQAPMHAYRPHMLDSECWCCYGVSGLRVRPVCYLAKYVNQDEA